MRILLLVLCLMFLPACVFHGIGIRSTFYSHHGYHRSYVSGYVASPTYVTMRIHMVDMQNSLYSILYVEDYLRTRGVEIIATHMHGPYIELRVRTNSLDPLHHFGYRHWCTLHY